MFFNNNLSHPSIEASTVARIVFAFLLLATTLSANASTLTGVTSHPNYSVFVRGEPVSLTFTADSVKTAGTSLTVDVSDVDGGLVLHKVLPVTADAAGKWTVSVPAPSNRLGYFEVKARLSTGEELPAVGSRAAGYLTYMVTVDPKERINPGEDAFFGMQGGFTTAFDARPYLGIHWVLSGYRWGEEEPDHPGQFAEKRQQLRQHPDLAAQAGREAERKLDILPLPTLLNGTPKWAIVGGKAIYTTGVLQDLDSWRRYCAEVGRAAQEDYPYLKRHLFQITWEPVYPWGFPGTPEDLVRDYQTAFPALHAADPKAFVIGPTGAGISPGDLTWNESLFKAGIGKYLDGFAIHPYSGEPPEAHNLPANIRALKEMIHTYTGRDLPLYGTEQGWATGGDPAKELDQAEWLTRTYLIMLGEGFKINFAFYFADYPGEPGYGFFHNLNMAKIPWGTDSVSPKPVAAAYAALTFLLEGHHAVQPIEWLGQTALGYSYQRGNEVILALWDYGDSPREVNVPVGKPLVEVLDWMGNGRQVSTPGGSLHLRLDPTPQYVRGVSLSLWGAGAARPLTIEPARLTVFPGSQVRLAAKIPPISGHSTASTLRTEPVPELEIAGASKLVLAHDQTVPLTFNIPPDAPPGAFPLRVELDRNGQMAGMAAAMLRVQEPLAIETITPASSNSLKIKLHNQQPEPTTGILGVRLRGVPGARRLLPFTLPALGTAAVKTSFPAADLDPARSYSAEVTISTSTRPRTQEPKNPTTQEPKNSRTQEPNHPGTQEPKDPGTRRSPRPSSLTPHPSNHSSIQTSIHTVDFLTAPRLPHPPVMNGKLDDWNNIPVLSLAGREHLIRQPQLYNGVKDLSAHLQYAWDVKALYVEARVTDDHFVQEKDGYNTWQQDCIQLAFDTNPGKAAAGIGNLLAEAGGRSETEISLALTTHGPEAYRTITPNSNVLPVGILAPAQLPLTIRKEPDGLVYEAAIPWSTLGLKHAPEPGAILGVAATVNDADEMAQAEPKALGLFGGITPTKDPALFGQMLLGATEPDAQASTPRAATMKVSGFLGQSSDTPLPWTGCAGAMMDAQGRLWTTSGNRAWCFRDRVLAESVPLPANVRAMRGDGRQMLLLGSDDRFYSFDTTTGKAALLADAHAGSGVPRDISLGKIGNFYALYPDGSVRGWTAIGQARGELLKAPPGKNWAYISIGVDPQNGDLVLGSGYPDDKLYRYHRSDGNSGTGDWRKVAPKVSEAPAGFAVQLAPFGGQLWMLNEGGGAAPLSGTGQVSGQWGYYPTGLAGDKAGNSWIACAQGLVEFDRRGQPAEHRIGGWADPGLLALGPDGTLLALLEQGGRVVRLLADDYPDAPFSSNANEPWRVGDGWTGRAAGIGWDGDGYLVLDSVAKCLWGFHPNKTIWGEKPWVRLTPEGAFHAPRLLAVGDASAFVLDGDTLLRTSLSHPETPGTPVSLPVGIKAADIVALAAGGDNRLYLATASTVTALDLAQGQVWQVGGFQSIAGLAARGNQVFVLDRTAGRLAALDVRDGKSLAILDSTQVHGGWDPAAITAGVGGIFVSDARGHRIIRVEAPKFSS